MDIFKLFFEHDIRLDKTIPRGSDRRSKEQEGSIEEFMKPIPTCSKFYLTGTRLDREEFGLNILAKSGEIIEHLGTVFKNRIPAGEMEIFDTFRGAIEQNEIGEAVALVNSREDLAAVPFGELRLDEDSNVGHRKEILREVLETGTLVLYKEQAHNGYDLHLFSRKNIYEALFYAIKELIAPDFRFFSINSKRVQSERKFYFETWTLDKPPHGAEEVHPETTL